MENSRINNFDFLRILFASLVIVSHSFPLNGMRDKEILRVLTQNQADFGGIAVKGFFIISGYLIYRSLLRSKSYKNFIWKRVLRLYPGLIIMTLVILLIIPFIYTGETALWQNKYYFTYAPRTWGLFNLQFDIPGVFENLPYHTINGSLWTICYEFTLYIITGLLFFINKKLHIWLVIITVIVSYILATFYPRFLDNFLFSKIYLSAPNFYILTCFFFSGVLLTFVNIERFKWKFTILILASILLIISLYIKVFSFVYYFLFPIIVIFFGSSSLPYINKIGIKIGDNSYGIYIYGWFIQQLLLYWFGLDTFSLIFLSLVVAFIVGYLSWHLVEKKALSYKNLIA